uniref:Protein krueppel n=1 Tax=Anopheles maculatus TaxID=74869 RepID=A0A182SL18_9DIPT
MSETSCRLCLGEVHPDDRGSSILEALFRSAIDRVFSFEIQHDGNLPTYTCNDCSQQVWDFNSYSQLVQKNQNTLQQRRLQNDKPSKSNVESEGFPLQPIDPDRIKKETVTSDEESETPLPAPDHVMEECGLLSAIKTEPNELDEDVQTLSDQVVVKAELNINDTQENMEVAQAVENATASGTAPTFDTADIKKNEGSDSEVDSNDSNDSEDDVETNAAQSEEPLPSKNLIEKMRERIRERIAAHKADLRCNICDRTYPNERYLKTHNDVVHAPYIRRRPWFPCDLCNKTFLQKSLLQNHRKTHVAMTQPSTAAGKDVSSRKLDPGTGSTIDQYAFRCNACLKTFPCHKSLRTHVDVMHPDMARQPQTYSCDQCDRTYDDCKKLNKHRLLHKFQQCTVCKKQLLKQNIRQHLRAHEA